MWIRTRREFASYINTWKWKLYCQLLCPIFWRKSCQSLDKLYTEFRINLQKYRQFPEYSTEKITEEVYTYITMKRYNNDTADLFVYTWGLHFLKFHVKNKQQWGSLVLLIKKACRKTVSRICTLACLIVLGFILNI